LALAASAASAQQIYRCGNTFSQQPCGLDAKELQIPGAGKQPLPLKDTPPSAQVQDAAKAMCLEQLKASLKDPDSMRVGTVMRFGPKYIEVWDKGNQAFRKTPAVLYGVEVNAKNGFGGYTGMKTYRCNLDPSETTVLRIEN